MSYCEGVGSKAKRFNRKFLYDYSLTPYPQYVEGCPNPGPMQRAEAIAQQQKLGVWADPSRIPPWEWRQRQ